MGKKSLTDARASDSIRLISPSKGTENRKKKKKKKHREILKLKSGQTEEHKSDIREGLRIRMGVEAFYVCSTEKRASNQIEKRQNPN